MTHFLGNTVLSRVSATTACALAIVVAIQLSSATAEAQEFRLNLETAGAIFIDEPQSDRFGPGFHLAVRPGISLGSVVDLQWSYSLLVASADDGFDETGTAHSFTTGLRLRPFAELDPEPSHLDGFFVDFNIGYVRTDDLDRVGFDTGIGYNFQVMSMLALGPFIRYTHVIQPDDLAGMDPNDAQILALGLNVSFGLPDEREVSPESLECPVCPTCEDGPICEPDGSLSTADSTCLDWDNDTVCDDDDRCPTQAGSESMYGCPVDPCTGDPIIVRVQFDVDSAGMPKYRSTGKQAMDPVLDAVSDAIGKNDSCRVCIIGHSSEEGAADYNQNLSVARAEAVKQYMTARGVSGSRIPTSGVGEMCPLVPDDTLVMNRRVEFHRLEEGESCPTSCL